MDAKIDHLNVYLQFTGKQTILQNGYMYNHFEYDHEKHQSKGSQTDLKV